MGSTQQVARFVCQTQEIPEAALGTARWAILDGLGVALAGSRDPAGQLVAQQVKEEGARPRATVIGQGFRTSPSLAALANGSAAHALDYDDVAPSWMVGHPTATLLPAILALGEARNISGRAALEAWAVGFEVGARLGQALGYGHYERGYHATATLGVMGAASASARLLGLGPEATAAALALAASQAGGLRQNFGTMAKPLHAGLAARGGVLAALLAQRGFTAAADILEGPLGFGAVLGSPWDPSPLEHLGRDWEVLASGLAFKAYPCCSEAHRCLDAVLELRRNYRLRPQDVAEVHCYTSDVVPQILIHHQPTTPQEARFSLEFALAVALVEGQAGLSEFTQEKLALPQVRELMGRVHYVHPPEARGLAGLARPEMVIVRLRDGREFRREVAYALGSPGNPMSEAELAQKFRRCAGQALRPSRAEAVLEALLGMADLASLRSLAPLLRSAGEKGKL